jgi:uncharacterized protein
MSSGEKSIAKRLEFEGFWDGLRQGHVAFPKCFDCGRFHWYPMPRCPHCRSDKLAWQRTNGKGRLYSWTVVERALVPAFKDKVPYIIGLVELDDAPGVRFVTGIVGAPPEALAIDMFVEAVIERTDKPMPTAPFRPVVI